MSMRWRVCICPQCSQKVWETIEAPHSQAAQPLLTPVTVPPPAPPRGSSVLQVNKPPQSPDSMGPCRRCRLGLPAIDPADNQCPLTRLEIRALQTRELRPEDYDMLLQLDDAVDFGKPGCLLTPTDCERLLLTPPPGTCAGDLCAICLSAFTQECMDLRQLPCCKHRFHLECIQPWLTTRKATCPLDGFDVRENQLGARAIE